MALIPVVLDDSIKSPGSRSLLPEAVDPADIHIRQDGLPITLGKAAWETMHHLQEIFPGFFVGPPGWRQNQQPNLLVAIRITP